VKTLKFALVCLGMVLISACAKSGAPNPGGATNPRNQASPQPQDLSQGISVGDGMTALYKGYAEISRLIRVRTMAVPSNFELSLYLDQDPNDVKNNGLLALLGSYADSLGTSSDFQNGVPNSINLMIWGIELEGFAQDVARICDPAPAPSPSPSPAMASTGASAPAPTLEQRFAPVFSENFKSVVSPFCAGATTRPFDRDSLAALWSELLLFDAPSDEMDAWIAFGMGPDVSAMESKAAIQTLVLTALYNPYFLMRH